MGLTFVVRLVTHGSIRCTPSGVEVCVASFEVGGDDAPCGIVAGPHTLTVESR